MRMQWMIGAVVFLSGIGLAPASAEEALRLTFTGDLMAHAKNQSMPNYDDIYDGVAPWLQSDDWSFINLETPVDADRPSSGYPLFSAKPAYVEAAVRAGFDVFSLANNHAIDYGAASVDGTLAALRGLSEKWPLRWSGLRDAAPDPVEPVVLEKKGWRVGFVSLTNLLNLKAGRARVNLVTLWDVWSPAVYPKEQEALLEQIRRWRRQVDFLVVGLHDGVEYAAEPSAAQVDLYDRMLDAGVDVLWGHHPHFVQRWKWKDTPRGKRLLLYSLGNFVSNQTQGIGPTQWAATWAPTGDGVLFRVTLHREGTGVGVEVEDPVLLNNFRDPQKGVVVLPTQVLVETAPEPWREYYRHRLEVQQSWWEAGRATGITRQMLSRAEN